MSNRNEDNQPLLRHSISSSSAPSPESDDTPDAFDSDPRQHHITISDDNNSRIVLKQSVYANNDPTIATPSKPSPSSLSSPTLIMRQNVQIFGVDLSKLRSDVRFVFLVSGLFVSYVLYSILQESLFVHYNFNLGLFMTFCQFLAYGGLGIISLKILGIRRSAPMKSYFNAAALSVASMGLSNLSLAYLDLPTQIIFKSCKLIVVMIAGRFFPGPEKRYSKAEYFSAVLLVLGIIALSQANASVSVSLHPLGVLLVTGGLLADSLVGNTQDELMRQHNASATEVVAYLHLIGLGYLFVACLFTGQLFEGIAFCFANPGGALILFSFASLGFVGVNFFMTLMESFGVFIAVATTSTRKAVTLLLSFLIFPKPISFLHFIAFILVFSGIGLNIHTKNKNALGDLKSVFASFRSKPSQDANHNSHMFPTPR